MTDTHPRAISLKLLVDVARTSMALVDAEREWASDMDADPVAALVALKDADKKWRAAVEAIRAHGGV